MTRKAAEYVRWLKDRLRLVMLAKRGTRSKVVRGYIVQFTSVRSSFAHPRSLRKEGWANGMYSSGLLSITIPYMQSAKDGRYAIVWSKRSTCAALEKATVRRRLNWLRGRQSRQTTAHAQNAG